MCVRVLDDQHLQPSGGQAQLGAMRKGGGGGGGWGGNTSIYDEQHSDRHYLPLSTRTGRLATCSLGNRGTASTAIKDDKRQAKEASATPLTWHICSPGIRTH